MAGKRGRPKNTGEKNPNEPRYTPGSRQPTKLTARQSAMLDAYFENGFAKKAAMLTAGYSEKTASFAQSMVWNKPLIQKEIARRKKKLAKKHELTQDWIIERFMRLALSGETLAKFKTVQSDGSLAWDFTGATEEELSVITELGVDFYTEGRGKGAIQVKKFRVKHPDVQAALTALARHLGLFNDSIELKGSLAERIQAGRDRAFKGDGEDTDDSVDTVH